MKAVLISIQPKWCELIASGKKTVEVRKTRPKIKTPFKCYIYCTQGLFKDLGIIGNTMYEKRMKVIGEFVCKSITDIKPFGFDDLEEFEKQTCLNSTDIVRYLKGFYGYGWHISELVIYDEPKDLSEFKTVKEIGGYEEFQIMARPPQSWCYVEDMLRCKNCAHNKVCAEVDSLHCRSDFVWYKAESGCPHYVARLEQDVTRLVQEKDNLIKNYAECMKDYAREIFAEIEHEMFMCDPDYGRLYRKFNELKNKYTEGEKSCPDCKYFVGCETACGGEPCDSFE